MQWNENSKQNEGKIDTNSVKPVYTIDGVRLWYCGTLVLRTGGGRAAGRRKVCLDMIILAIDTGTSD